MFNIKMYLVIAGAVLMFAPNARTLDGCVSDKFLYYNVIDCHNHIDNILPSISTGGFGELNMYNIQNITEAIKQLKEVISARRIDIDEVSFINSNINTLPADLLTIDTDMLIITRSYIPAINLNMLPYAKTLKSLILKHNSIKEFETESLTYLSTKQLKNIDLSFNEIKNVPFNAFYSTRDSLKKLDLSHNQISSLDYYTFANLGYLEDLDLSHNKLINVGLFLYTIRNLRTLHLENNQINELNVDLFSKSTQIKELYLSYNKIEKIEDEEFGALANLQYLELSHNKIGSIKESLLRNNTDLAKLDISFNNISFVEPGSFSSLKNIRKIKLDNAFSMAIDGQLFMGLRVNELNFSGSTIGQLLDRPFISQGDYLRKLNLKSCGIHEISETAFESLTTLTELDLSNNQLSEIAFRTTDLANLVKLYVRSNLIQELKVETFKHLLSLTELDLSNNKINTIPPMTFKNLKNLKTLNIVNNALDNAILPNTFFGLENVEHLELINTNVVRWDRYAFTGLKNLKVLNASHGQLTYLDSYAFTGISNIEILDISYNQILDFNVILIPNKNMKELYLNNNQLRNILVSAFEGFHALKILNISNNNLITVSPKAFKPLKSMQLLDLSHNPEIKLSGDDFSDLPALKKVLLRNASNLIGFESANITIKNIDLSSSSITNLSLLHIHNVTNIERVDLSKNNLTFLNQHSFGGVMPTLTWLNLSHSNIERIYPGTFVTTTSIESLDLSFNKLFRIEYGALNGLNNLKVLNLSNNAIKSFSLTQLYYIPSVTEIFLDNNSIFSLNLPELGKYSLKTLSVGGNELSCDDILDLKLRSKVTITAKTLDIFSENVDGIKCTLSSMEVICANNLSDTEPIPNFDLE